jgi:effector-binding domain-containing protein
VEERSDIDYLGIRLVTPFRGVLAKRDELLRELDEWLGQHGVGEIGSFFLRFNVVNMEADMDIEVGVITPDPPPGAGRVAAGVLPGGRYATLTYRDHARRANRMLLEWARDNDVTLDSGTEPAGDRFGCRYEAYLTDPRKEPRKTKWEVELIIRAAP